jgi:cytochrome c oxidase subunit 4
MNDAPASTSAWTLWRRLLPVWAALLVLLAITFSAAYVPLGSFNLVVALTVAALKAALVGVIFMGLGRNGSLLRLAASAGFFWLIILFTLTFSDFLTRQGVQPAQ